MTLIVANSTQPRRLTAIPFPAAHPAAGYRDGTGAPRGAGRYRHTPKGPTVTQTRGPGRPGLGEGAGLGVGARGGVGGGGGDGEGRPVRPGPGARRSFSAATRGPSLA